MSSAEDALQAALAQATKSEILRLKLTEFAQNHAAFVEKRQSTNMEEIDEDLFLLSLPVFASDVSATDEATGYPIKGIYAGVRDENEGDLKHEVWVNYKKPLKQMETLVVKKVSPNNEFTCMRKAEKALEKPPKRAKRDPYANRGHYFDYENKLSRDQLRKLEQQFTWFTRPELFESRREYENVKQCVSKVEYDALKGDIFADMELHVAENATVERLTNRYNGGMGTNILMAQRGPLFPEPRKYNPKKPVTRYNYMVEEALERGIEEYGRLRVDNAPPTIIKDLAKKAIEAIPRLLPKEPIDWIAVRSREDDVFTYLSRSHITAFFTAADKQMFAFYYDNLLDHFEEFNSEGKNVARAVVKYYPFLQNSVELTPSEKEELGCVLGAVVDLIEEKIAEGTKLVNDEVKILYLLVTHWKGTLAKALNLIVDEIMGFYDRWDEVITSTLNDVLILLSKGFTNSTTIFIDDKFRSLGVISYSMKVRTKRFAKEIWPRIPAHARLREVRNTRVTEVPYKGFNKIIEDAGLADEFYKAILIPLAN